MIVFVLVEIALLCVLVLLIRVAIRRGMARTWEDDYDFGDEIQPKRADTFMKKSTVTISVFPKSEGTQRKAG